MIVATLKGYISAGTVPSELAGIADEINRDGCSPPLSQEEISAAINRARRESRAAIRNYRHVMIVTKKGSKDGAEPLPSDAIADSIFAATGGWPRRVGGSLFVDDGGSITFLLKQSSLFAYISRKAGLPADFKSKPGYFTKEETLSHLQQTAREYLAIEQFPHFPPIKGHYYACKTPCPGDGSALEKLVSRYCPETDADRELILAAIVTLFWGGAPGSRPAFAITANGKGKGKSTLVQTIAGLVGGHVSIQSSEDGAVTKARLLSADARLKRAVLCDNVKTYKLSSAEIESLITEVQINGKQMYVGDASRPNTLVWFITSNGLSFSADLAQRCVVIRLGEPKHDGAWESETVQFIDENREGLIADVVAFFNRPKVRLNGNSRWGAWENEILARLKNPEQLRSVIRERQAVADSENDEAGIIADYFAERLRGLAYKLDNDRIFIPSRISTDWLKAATHEKGMTATAATRRLRQLIEEGQLPRLEVNKTKSYGRGFTWIGASWVDADTKTDLPHLLAIRNVNECP